MNALALIYSIVALGVGVAFGYYLRQIIAKGKRENIDTEVKEILLSAKVEAQRILDESKSKYEERMDEIKKEEKQKEADFKQTENRLIKKEELLDARQTEMEKEAENIKLKNDDLEKAKSKIKEIEDKKLVELERISKMTKDEAVSELMRKIERDAEEDLSIRLAKLENDGREKLDKRAKEILSTTVQRLASSTASELMTTSVSIPNEEIKGKIIGKEGRNIKAFEKSAGVELIVDDTPGALIISSFDPVRRQIARVALENLILDGRIQPAKIEEFVEKAKEDINKIIKEKGEQAVFECGIYNFDPRLISIIGRLYFRTSYGQNVLQHSIEMCHLAGMLAEELGADVAIAKAGALVHDIGKALDHEVQGTHIDIGIRILQKFNADPRIITAMKSHHDDCPHETMEAVIVQTADYISGGRPGARKDTIENYIKRLSDMEALVKTFDGIEKVYALSAGREIRVFATPSEVSDVEAKEMAREIAKKIEQELKYPGEIRVVMIRELRVVEFAR